MRLVMNVLIILLFSVDEELYIHVGMDHKHKFISLMHALGSHTRVAFSQVLYNPMNH